MIVVKNKKKIDSIHPSADFVEDKVLVASLYTRFCPSIQKQAPICCHLIYPDGQVAELWSENPRHLDAIIKIRTKTKDSIKLPEEFRSENPFLITRTNYGHAVLRQNDCLAIGFLDQLLYRTRFAETPTNLQLWGHLPDLSNPHGNHVLVFRKHVPTRYCETTFVNSHRQSVFTMMSNFVVRSSKSIFVCMGSARRIIRVIDVESLEVVNDFQMSHPVHALAVRPDNTVLACVGCSFTTYLDI